MCKSLVLHYHCTFGRISEASLNEHKKYLLEWLKVIIPQLAATELVPEEWIDGKYLSSLLQYCSKSGVSNMPLSKVMQEALIKFGIPPLLQQSTFSPTSADAEFILMMYLYFFVTPCKDALLKWINTFPNISAPSFEKDWCDGSLIYQVVRNLAPKLPSVDEVACQNPVKITELAISGAQSHLSISSHFKASDISNPVKDPFPLILFLSQLHNIPQSVFTQHDKKRLECVGSTVSIKVENKGSPGAVLQAVAKSDSHDPEIMEPGKCLEKDSTTFVFTPQHVGHFTITITCNGIEVPNSAVKLEVYDPEKCRLIDSLKDVYLLGQTIALGISTSEAGEGDLTASLALPSSHNNVVIPRKRLHRGTLVVPHKDVTVQKLDSHKFQVMFTPDVEGVHELFLSFNNQDLKNPLKFDCRPIFIESPKTSPIKGRFSFRVLTSVNVQNIAVSVLDPHKKQIQVQRGSNKSYWYIPMEAGDYVISVTLNGRHIEGSPFSVCHPDIYVREYPVNHCVVNQPITTILDASEGITGTISEDGFNVDISYSNNINFPHELITIKPIPEEINVFTVNFTPKKTGIYSMKITYNKMAISDPDPIIKFEVIKPRISVREMSSPPYLVNQPITMILDANKANTPTVDKRDINVHVDIEQELVCAEVNPIAEEHNVFQVQFTPMKTGNCNILLRFGEGTIPEDTVLLNITKPVLLDPKLEVKDFSHEKTNCLVKLNLFAKGAMLEGFKYRFTPTDSVPLNFSTSNNYSVVAIGKKTTVYPEFSSQKEGEFSILISTLVPDIFKLYVYYYSELISCCPFSVDITPKVITYDAVVPFEMGPTSFIELVLDISNAQTITKSNHLSVEVFSGTTRPPIIANVVEEADDLFRASFSPKEYGDYRFEIKWFSLPISSSMISFKQRTVQPPVTIEFQPNFGPRVSLSARLDRESERVSETSAPSACKEAVESGSYEVNDSPLPKLAVQQYKRGCYEISFLDHQSGKYLLHVFCFGQEINGSPFPVNCNLVMKSPVSGDKLRNVVLNGSDVFSASVEIQGQKTNVPITHLDATPELATIEFEDTERHIYDLRLYWNHIEFEGSPFSLHESAAKKQGK